jgi:hypothetical protein
MAPASVGVLLRTPGPTATQRDGLSPIPRPVQPNLPRHFEPVEKSLRAWFNDINFMTRAN